MRNYITILLLFVSFGMEAQLNIMNIINNQSKQIKKIDRIVSNGDNDSTNEIQDTSNIVGLLEFVQNNGDILGKFVDGTDPLDAVYMDGNVGIGISAPAYGSKLHVLGSVYFKAGLENLFMNRSGNTTLSGDNNIGIGTASLEALTSGSKNLGLGYESLQALTTGSNNFALGGRALETLTTGTNNVGIGFRAGGSIDVAASYNMSIGTLSLGNASGNNNVGVGYYAGYGSTGNTVAIGYFAGFTGSAGSVAIGYNAGRNNTVSNRLYIDNSSTATPLLYGEFDNNKITINGDLTVTDRIGGAATKSAFFDATGQLVEGNLDADSDPTNEIQDTTNIVGLLEFVQNNGGSGGAADDQTLTLTSSTLAISEGNTVNLNVAYGGLESTFKTISSTSATKADFSANWGEEINTTASTTSDRITVDSTAMYTILVRGDITNYTLDEEIKLVIKVNGVTVENHKTYCHNTTEFDINYTDDIEMNATDYIEIYLDSVTDTDYEYNDLKLTVKRAY
jgi:hypothetical protein